MRFPIVLLSALLATGCGSAPEQGEARLAAAADTGLTIELPPEEAENAVAPDLQEAEAPATESPAPPPVEPEPETSKPAVKAEEPAPAAEKRESGQKVQAEPPQERDAAEARLLGARPPISNAEIARTIRRIGYPCEEVTAAGRVEDSGAAEPAFRINCSSGATYRGTTRNGRLFFRPWENGSSGR